MSDIILLRTELEDFYNHFEKKIETTVKQAIETNAVKEIVLQTFTRNQVKNKLRLGYDRINRLIKEGILQETPDGSITGKSLVEYAGYKVLTEKNDN